MVFTDAEPVGLHMADEGDASQGVGEGGDGLFPGSPVVGDGDDVISCPEFQDADVCGLCEWVGVVPSVLFDEGP